LTAPRVREGLSTARFPGGEALQKANNPPEAGAVIKAAGPPGRSRTNASLPSSAQAGTPTADTVHYPRWSWVGSGFWRMSGQQARHQ